MSDQEKITSDVVAIAQAESPFVAPEASDPAPSPELPLDPARPLDGAKDEAIGLGPVDPPSGVTPKALIGAQLDPSPIPSAAAASPPAAPRRAGFVAPMFGGALAAIGGFALSHFNVLDLRQEVDLTSISAPLLQKIDAQGSQISANDARLTEALALAETLAQAPQPSDPQPEINALRDQLAKLETSLATASQVSDQGVTPAMIAALREEVSALKSDPTPPDPDAVRALVSTELENRAAAATAAAEAEAAEIRRAAQKDAARLGLIQAVETGAPYAQNLLELELTDVPAVLKDHAETGLPTMAILTRTFADPARAALDASLRANAGEDLGARAWSFLRIQTGARSLTPQEGADPDAILSRAEAALQAGDLPRALSEIDTLPPEGQAALSDWRNLANVRLEGLAALSSLTVN